MQENTHPIQVAIKNEYVPPTIQVLGEIEDLTGEGGPNSNDGWGYSTLYWSGG